MPTITTQEQLDQEIANINNSSSLTDEQKAKKVQKAKENYDKHKPTDAMQKTATNIANASLAGSNDNNNDDDASLGDPANRALAAERDAAQLANNKALVETIEKKAAEETSKALGNENAKAKVQEKLDGGKSFTKLKSLFDTNKEEETAALEGKGAVDNQKELDDRQNSKNQKAEQFATSSKNKDFLDSLSMAKDQYGNPIVDVSYDDNGKATIQPTKTMSRQEFYKAYGSSPSKLRNLFGSLLTAAQGVGAFFGIPPVANGDKILDQFDKEGAKANIDRDDAYNAYKELKNSLNTQIIDATGQAASTLIQNKANADTTKTNAADEDLTNALRKAGVEEADLKDYSDKLQQMRARADSIFKGNQDKDFAAFQSKLSAAQQEEIAAFMQDLANSAPTEQLKKMLSFYDNDPTVAAYVGATLAKGDPNNYLAGSAGAFKALQGVLLPIFGALASDKKVKSFVMPKLWT